MNTLPSRSEGSLAQRRAVPAPSIARPGLLAAGLLLVTGLLLGGCSQMQPLINTFNPNAKPPGPPLVDLQVDAPDALKPLLEKHLDLARLLVLPSE